MRNHRWVAGLVATVCCFSLIQTVSAQEGRRQERRGDDPPRNVTPERFVQIAAMAGMAEVALGKLASEQASMDNVRKFARQMVEDHAKANKELMAIAETKQIPIPKSLDAKHKEMEQRLSGLSGPAFDREYVIGQVKAHQEAVTLFTQFSESGQDRELKSFATQTLPRLKEHLMLIQEIAGKVKRTP